MSSRNKENSSKLWGIHHETEVILNYDLLSSVLRADLTRCSYGYTCNSAICLIGRTAADSAAVSRSPGPHPASLYFPSFFFWQVLVSDFNLKW